MYGAVLPTYDPDSKDKKGDNEVINCDDPQNKDRVRSILFD